MLRQGAISVTLLFLMANVQAKRGLLFSRRLAEKHGYELTENEKIVDSGMQIVNYMTDDPGYQKKKFAKDKIIKWLESKSDCPLLKSIRTKLENFEKSEKQEYFTLMEVSKVFEERFIATGIDPDVYHEIAKKHELFNKISKTPGIKRWVSGKKGGKSPDSVVEVPASKPKAPSHAEL